MGKAARLRHLRRVVRAQPPMRQVPSRRGVVTVFVIDAVLGYASGLLGLWLTRGLWLS